MSASGKVLMPGTPTHPDIPRPMNVPSPAPIPGLIKKSRGRQVPSIGNNDEVLRERSRDTTAPTGVVGVVRSGSIGRGDRGRETIGSNSRASSWRTGQGRGTGVAPGSLGNGSTIGMLNGSSGLSGNGGSSSREPFFINTTSTNLDSWRRGNDSSSGGIGKDAFSASVRASLMHKDLTSLGRSNTLQSSDGVMTGVTLTTTDADIRSRPFVCEVEGCGKAYIRAEHLKRHIRSIHTNDKREFSLSPHFLSVQMANFFSISI